MSIFHTLDHFTVLIYVKSFEKVRSKLLKHTEKLEMSFGFISLFLSKGIYVAIHAREEFPDMSNSIIVQPGKLDSNFNEFGWIVGGFFILSFLPSIITPILNNRIPCQSIYNTIRRFIR